MKNIEKLSKIRFNADYSSYDLFGYDIDLNECWDEEKTDWINSTEKILSQPFGWFKIILELLINKFFKYKIMFIKFLIRGDKEE